MAIDRFDQLRVYQRAFDAAMVIFDASKHLPREERYSLIDQIRRSSRSVAANIAEAWSKRRFERHFISKLTDAHAEAEETVFGCTSLRNVGISPNLTLPTSTGSTT